MLFAAPFVIPPISNHTHTLILLHDRGSSGQDFGLDFLNATDSSRKLLQSLFPGTKFVFPNAAYQCVTSIFGGPKMPQWFDIVSTQDPTGREALQFKGLREGSLHVHDIINAETIALENIVLGGFSQGSAMALYALLAYRSDEERGHLGGFVGLSGWLPLRTSLDHLIDRKREDRETSDIDSQISDLLRNQIGLPPATSTEPRYGDIPIFLVHGDADDEVPIKLAEQTIDSLNKLGFNATMKSCDGLKHAWRNGDEIDDIATFLSAEGVT